MPELPLSEHSKDGAAIPAREEHPFDRLRVFPEQTAKELLPVLDAPLQVSDVGLVGVRGGEGHPVVEDIRRLLNEFGQRGKVTHQCVRLIDEG